MYQVTVYFDEFNEWYRCRTFEEAWNCMINKFDLDIVDRIIIERL